MAHRRAAVTCAVCQARKQQGCFSLQCRHCSILLSLHMASVQDPSGCFPSLPRSHDCCMFQLSITLIPCFVKVCQMICLKRLKVLVVCYLVPKIHVGTWAEGELMVECRAAKPPDKGQLSFIVPHTALELK